MGSEMCIRDRLSTWVSFQSAEQSLLGQFSVSGNSPGHHTARPHLLRSPRSEPYPRRAARGRAEPCVAIERFRFAKPAEVRRHIAGQASLCADPVCRDRPFMEPAGELRPCRGPLPADQPRALRSRYPPYQTMIGAALASPAVSFRQVLSQWARESGKRSWCSRPLGVPLIDLGCPSPLVNMQSGITYPARG